MTFLDFDPADLRKSRTATAVEEPTVVLSPVVVQTITSTPLPETSAAYLAKPDGSWGWEDLRDYVVREIESRHGVQPRDFRKESGIFKSFMTRYGADSVAIARLAFSPVFDGWWKSAPITVTRFCKGSDVYFGDVLQKRLHQ